MRAQMRGFTLFELMTGFVIVGVLGIFVVNNYASHIEKARLAEAKSEIAHIAMQIEKFATRPDNPSGALPDSLAELGLDAQFTTDPWGNPYQYLDLDTLNGVGGARKDHKNVQLNTDYDLYSFGKDGVSNQTFTSSRSIDDIVRGTDGAFIGTPAEYSRLPSDY